MEFVQQNVLVAFGATAVEGLVPRESSVPDMVALNEAPNVPGVARKLRQLLRQRQDLHLRCNRHLQVRIELAMADERQQPVRVADRPIEVAGGIIRVDVLALDLQMCLAHLRHGPRCRRDHTL